MTRTWTPSFAAAAVLVALPWLNPFAGGPSPSVHPWLVSMACGLALWLLAGTQGGHPRRAPVGVALVVVLGSIISMGQVRPEHAMLAGGLALVIAASAVDGARAEGGLAQGAQAGLLVAACLSALIALAQYFGLAAPLSPWVNVTQLGEAFGNLRQPNQFASLCWLGVAVIVWGGLRLPTPVAVGLVALLALGSATSASRTGLLHAAFLCVLAGLWPQERRRRLALSAGGLVLCVVASVILPDVLEGITGQELRKLFERIAADEGCSSRRVLWSNVLHLIAQRPWVGWGWGELDFAHYTTLYAAPRFCDILDNAHNLPLHLAVELGVPAALVLCACLAVWIWRRAPWREAGGERQLAWAWLGILVNHSLLEYPLWYGPFQIVLGLVIAALPLRATAPAGPASSASGAHATAWLLAPLALVAATAYAAWDYARVSQIYLPPEQRHEAWKDDTLQHIRRSWLFSGPAGFADLTLTALTPENAEAMHGASLAWLHYSPEPRVIERVIESATMLGRTEEAVQHLARYRAAFPKDYLAWREAQKRPLPVPGG